MAIQALHRFVVLWIVRVGGFSDEASKTRDTLNVVCDEANLLVSFRAWIVVQGHDLCVPPGLQLLDYFDSVGMDVSLNFRRSSEGKNVPAKLLAWSSPPWLAELRHHQYATPLNCTK